MKYIFFLILFAFTVKTGQAQISPMPVDPMQPLRHQLRFLEDPTHQLSIQEVKNLPGSMFLPYPEGLPNYRSTWWARLQVLPSFSSKDYFVGLAEKEASGLSRGNDVADVWIFSGDSLLDSHITGNLSPVSRRPADFSINENLFPLPLAENQPLEVFIKLRRVVDFVPLRLDFFLQHRSVAEAGPAMMHKIAWFYAGVMFIMFFFGLVFYIITKEKSFAWFFGLASCLFLHMLLLEPESQFTKIFLSNAPVIQFYLFEILTMLGTLFLLQFVRSFVNMRSLFPAWDKVMKVALAYWATLMMVSIASLTWFPDAPWLRIFSAMGMLFTMVIGIRLIVSSNIYAISSGFALLWLCMFQVLGVLWNLEWLPGWIPNPWVIAQIGMMVIIFISLAHRFRQRAREKAEADQVKELDALKTKFFSNISHELRTPLSLLIGPLREMEAGTVENGQEKKYVKLMRRNAERLLQLINQLMDLSKLESGKLELRVTRTDITSLFRMITASFESLAEQKGIHYHIHQPEKQLVGWCDRDKLEKIAGNLIANAFRFTPRNGNISISLQFDEKRLRFTVQDDGAGIPQEQISKIFDRFHQVPGTQGGTGLGLSLVKELLQLHKGQVSVQSEEGRGSSFRVSIPISAEFYQAGERVESTQDEPFEKLYNFDDDYDPENNVSESDAVLPLVLVVEDHADLRNYICDALKGNFRTSIAEDGLEGLEKAVELVPDCVISDVMMPELDGLELCDKLRQKNVTSHIPIILLTARARTESRIEGLSRGADDYLVKPFDRAELLVRVQNLIEQRRKLRDIFSHQVIDIHPEDLPVSEEKDFITKVRNLIDENLDNELFGVAELANEIHLSRSQLHRKLKSLTGHSPNEIIRNYRLERAMKLVTGTTKALSEIAFETGFSSAAYFSKCFSDKFGSSPLSFRSNIEGTRIK